MTTAPVGKATHLLFLDNPSYFTYLNLQVDCTRQPPPARGLGTGAEGSASHACRRIRNGVSFTEGKQVFFHAGRGFIVIFAK
jgi:hypothetical protein